MTTPTEQFTYHTLDTLQALSLAEVEALWELVPTERQRLYKAIYDRTRRDEGASGSDTLETHGRSALTRYADKGLVPSARIGCLSRCKFRMRRKPTRRLNTMICPLCPQQNYRCRYCLLVLAARS